MTTAEQRPINPPHAASLLASHRLGWIVACAWTALIIAIFVWVIHEAREMSLELASNEARANFDKDQALRRWGSSHGGIYVPVSELSRPSPYLAHVRGRDVVTTDGKHLTLLDPATMVRQLEGYAGLRDVAGRIVNRSPLNPANRPDEWELGALRAFEAGTTELRELISKDGKPYLRYMHAMRANESCLRCHGHQGYQTGAIVGGVGVTVALEPFFAREREEILDEARYFGFIWILGLVGIGTGTRRIARYSSEREQAEQSLRASEERYMLAARGANDGLWDWNLASSEVYYSPRWQQIFGYADGGIGTSPEEWMKRVHPDDRESLSSALEAHICGGTEHFEYEHRVQHANGDYLWVLARGLAIRDATGKALRMAGSFTDITDRKHAETQALHDALHDGLTGLPNRVLFTDRLQRLLARAERLAAHPFAVLFLDLDRFKTLNDSLGHAIGDQLLVATSERLRSCLRGQDTVARLGGDEFSILLEEVEDFSTVNMVVERIQQEFTRPFMLNGHEIYASASIGIALSNKNYCEAVEPLRDADTAMYRAKAAGRGGYAVFDEAMHTHALTLHETENDLRRAIERGELCVFYQPVINLADGNVIGFEALVRWRHPMRGLISPAEFIPIAEETGLIAALDSFVLQEASAQLARWQSEPGTIAPEWISVNLSARGFAQRALADEIRQLLEATSLKPQQIRLEITESVLMADADLALRVLTELHGLGIRLSIDDFGTGYSSLGYLHRFPIHTLKIDRSFVGGAASGLSNLSITSTVITLAHSLGLEVIAEGIETAEQRAQLIALHCRYGQGFLFARPLPAAEAGALLAGNRRP